MKLPPPVGHNVLWHLSQFCWHSEDVDRDMEFIMTVVKTIRSLRADYNLTKTRADCKMTRRQIQSNSRRLTGLALMNTVAVTVIFTEIVQILRYQTASRSY